MVDICVIVNFNQLFHIMENQEKLILSLIKDDLINMRLVYGLEDLGLGADDYYLHLKETILDLMGFTQTQRNDDMYAQFMDRMWAVRCLSIEQGHHVLDALAREIYVWLRAQL